MSIRIIRNLGEVRVTQKLKDNLVVFFKKMKSDYETGTSFACDENFDLSSEFIEAITVVTSTALSMQISKLFENQIILAEELEVIGDIADIGD